MINYLALGHDCPVCFLSTDDVHSIQQGHSGGFVFYLMLHGVNQLALLLVPETILDCVEDSQHVPCA